MASQSKDAGNTINQTVSRGKASSHYPLKKRKKYLGWVSAPVPLWDRYWGHGQSHLLLLSLFTLGKEKTPALFIWLRAGRFTLTLILFSERTVYVRYEYEGKSELTREKMQPSTGDDWSAMVVFQRHSMSSVLSLHWVEAFYRYTHTIA